MSARDRKARVREGFYDAFVGAPALLIVGRVERSETRRPGAVTTEWRVALRFTRPTKFFVRLSRSVLHHRRAIPSDRGRPGRTGGTWRTANRPDCRSIHASPG